MNRRQLEGYRAELEFRTLLASIRDYFQRGPNLDRKILMALNAQVQRLVDEVNETRDFKEAFLKSQDIITKQIADLKAEIARLVAGQSIDEENLNAIKGAVDQLDETNKALEAAVPNQEPVVPPPTTEELLAKGITQPVDKPAEG